MATISFIDKTTQHPLTINFHKDGDSLFSDRVRFLIVFASRTCVDRSRSLITLFREIFMFFITRCC